MSTPAIEIQGVGKQFGAAIAVKDVNLSIGAGEFFSLLGPSGCGKTTLLRMIAGFEQPSQGRILVNGQDVSGVPPYRRPVNMVFQNYALFPHLNVFDNVAFGLRSGKSVNKPEIISRVKEALELVRLGNFAQRLPSQLSGGQQQRVALARALVNRPAVLLLDEPLSALDSKIRLDMQEELAGLQQRLKMTFVMVTHDQGEALALSNRLAVFYHGHLEQVGTPKQVYEHPRTAFVADFIGHNNLVEAQVLDFDSAWVVVQLDGGLQLRVRPNPEVQLRSGETVVIWIGTNSLELSETVPGKDCSSDQLVNVFSADILSRSYQGTVTDYRLQLTEKLILRASCNGGDQTFLPGQTVAVSLPAEFAGLLPLENAAGQLVPS